MLKLRDVVEPSEFVYVYKDLQTNEYIGRLAPSLGAIIIYKLFDPSVDISTEFTDSQIFLSMTSFGKKKKGSHIFKALKTVNKALKGTSGSITLPLTLEMGFGKTHFLTLLFHLYTDIANSWKEIKDKPELSDVIELLVEADYKAGIAKKTILLPVDLKKTIDYPYEALFRTTAKIIEQYKKLGEESKKIANFVESLVKKEPKLAARELSKEISKLGEIVPVLILVDELYAAVFEAVAGAENEYIKSLKKFFIFLESFIDEISDKNPVVLVYASAQQDIKRWEDILRIKDKIREENPEAYQLILSTGFFKDRTARKEIELEKINPEDAIEIIIKRLLTFKLGGRDEAAKKLSTELSKVVEKILGKNYKISFSNEIVNTYPFSPTYRYLAEKLLAPTISGDLPRSQHIRDLIKITSSLISNVYEKGWDIFSLISPVYLSHNELSFLIEERLSMHWGGLYSRALNSLKEIQDIEIRELCMRILPIVYIKSLTTNIAKLFDMIRKPDSLPKNEVISRGTSLKDVIFSLVGAIPLKYLEKYTEAWDRVSKYTPNIIAIELGDETYLIMSSLFNPLELIESFKKEEILSFTSDGEFDVLKGMDYLKRHLLSEYSVTSQFIAQSQKGDINIFFLDYNLIEEIEKGKPKFVQFLDTDRFNVIIISPWSIMIKELEQSKSIDYAKEIIKVLSKHKNRIPYPNMLGIIIPSVTGKSVEKLCVKIAEIKAANKLMKYLHTEEMEIARKRRIELIERSTDYKVLLEFMREEEKNIEEILLETMESLTHKIQNYTISFVNSAVADYTSELISLFRRLVFFDPAEGIFIEKMVSIDYETKNKLEEIYAELPSWISRAVTNSCSLARKETIKSLLIENIIKPAITEKLEELIQGKEERIDVNNYGEYLLRGWKEIPIKPISKKEIEAAINSLRDTLFINGEIVKIDLRKESVGGKEHKMVVFNLIRRKSKEKEIVIKKRKVNTIKIRSNKVSNFLLALSLLEEKGDLFDYIDAWVITKADEGKRKGKLVFNFSKDRIELILEEVKNILYKISDFVEEFEITLMLKERTDEEKIKDLVEKVGLNMKNIMVE